MSMPMGIIERTAAPAIGAMNLRTPRLNEILYGGQVSFRRRHMQGSPAIVITKVHVRLLGGEEFLHGGYIAAGGGL